MEMKAQLHPHFMSLKARHVQNKMTTNTADFTYRLYADR